MNRESNLSWKTIARGMLKGINIPIFNPSMLFEEILFAAADAEEEKKWRNEIESLLLDIDDDIAAKLEKLERSYQFLAFSQIPQHFPEETKKKLGKNLSKMEQSPSADERVQLVSRFWDSVASATKSIDSQTLNDMLKTYLKKGEKELEDIKRQLVAMTPISKILFNKMNQSLQNCKDKNIAYQTPNFLLMLLQLDNSLLKRALDKVEFGLGNEYYERLYHYVSHKQIEKVEEGYIPFDWPEREWIRAAQLEAFYDEYPVVTEKHIVLGVLISNKSGTIKKFRKRLGDKYHQLIEIIRSEPSFKEIFTDISDI